MRKWCQQKQESCDLTLMFLNTGTIIRNPYFWTERVLTLSWGLSACLGRGQGLDCRQSNLPGIKITMPLSNQFLFQTRIINLVLLLCLGRPLLSTKKSCGVCTLLSRIFSRGVKSLGGWLSLMCTCTLMTTALLKPRESVSFLLKSEICGQVWTGRAHQSSPFLAPASSAALLRFPFQ